MESVNILLNIKRKYFYKSIRLIVFWVTLPLLFSLILLFIFQNEKIMKLLEIINL
jgi:hypothetical protein